jgi:Tol biopolymer transport system component
MLARSAALFLAAVFVVGCSQSAVSSPSPTPTDIPPSPTQAASAVPTTSPTPLPTPGLLGRVTFMRYGAAGHSQVWVGCADLSKERRVTDTPGHASGFSVWSPDGGRIAFDTDRDDPDLADDDAINDVYTMAPDGSDLLKLTDSTGAATDPTYSPDGLEIAYGDGGIFIVPVGGGEARRVTTPPDGALDLAPRYSADGTQLVFTRQKDKTHTARLVVNVDGSSEHELPTPNVNPGDAVWSPDGRQLVFEADAPGYPYGSVWRINADGTNLRNLVPKPSGPAGTVDGFADPVWSPHGGWVMLLHAVLRNNAVLTEGLAVMKPDGSGLTYVASGHGSEHQPDWSGVPC